MRQRYLIEPDQLVLRETPTLRLRVKVSAVASTEEFALAAGVFQEVNLKLAV